MKQFSKQAAEEYLEKMAVKKPKKKKSRFGGSNKVILPGMPTAIPASLSEEQLQMYLLQVQIEDFTRRIREEDVGSANIPIEDRLKVRSPSPEPIYDNEGHRVNSRQYRTRRKYEEKRAVLIDNMLKLNPTYTPPTDSRLSAGRMTDKVYIPQDNHPHINFVGLLIGPRGNTLKMLERESGARIIIRGKGSLKDTKGVGYSLPGEDEPLHAYITGCTEDQVIKAKNRISQIIKEGVELPESDNDLRKNQLKELALLNGTLQDPRGLTTLRERVEANKIYTNTVYCTRCGGAGHIASDCVVDLRTVSSMERNIGRVDNEYVALMNEIGQELPPYMQTAGIKQYVAPTPTAVDAYGAQLMLAGGSIIPPVVPVPPLVSPMMMPGVPPMVPPMYAPSGPHVIPPPPPRGDLDIPLPPPK